MNSNFWVSHGQHSEDDSGTSRTAFKLLESHGSDRVVHVQLIGELDLAAADPFSRRLAELVGAGFRVRIDLSRLEFIDSTGLHALVRAVMDGSADGRQLVEIDQKLTGPVQYVIDLVGVAPTLWPSSIATGSPGYTGTA